MKYHWVLPLVSAILNTVLGALVVTRAPRARLNRTFLLLSLSLASWNLNNFVFYAVTDPARALWWGNLFRTGTVLMPSTVLHLILSLSTTAPGFAPWLLVSSYALGLALGVANACGLLVAGVQQYPWGLYPVGTRLYGVYIGAAIVNCLLAFVILWREYRTSASSRRKVQARFWLLGAAVSIPAGLLNFLPMYGVPVYPMGHLGTTLYAAIIAYAIVRHRLMDIDVVITKGMAYGAVSLALIAPSFVLTLWLQRSSFGQVHTDFSVAVLFMFIAIGLLFPTLRRRAESEIERSLFGQKHGYRTALVAFTRSIVRILDGERLIRELGTTLAETLQLDRIAVVIHDESKRLFISRYSVGAFAAVPELPEEHPLIRSLLRHPTALLRNEIEESASAAQRIPIAEVCERNSWEVCIPLQLGTKLIGFIGLGRKRNLDAYYAEDLELLETLAAEASVALENARLYEELKRSQDIIRRADRLSALGTLAAGIAHEVRNPLVSIQTFFQLAPDRLHDEEFFTSFLGMTANEVKRISNLITELLSFARSATPSLGPVNLNELADRVATLLEPEARKNKLSLRRELSTPAPVVRADGDQIKQVLINLVLNAIQATAEGGTVSIATCVMNHRGGVLGQLQVRDTGIGIPLDRIDHIFDPFFTTKDKGTGLGLAIAHQIVTEHGGSITVDSREGHGTTFVVNLPAYAEEATPDLETIEADAIDLRYALPRKVAS